MHTPLGVGEKVIKQGLAQELDGEVHMDYKSDGLVCTMSFQAPQVNVDG